MIVSDELLRNQNVQHNVAQCQRFEKKITERQLKIQLKKYSVADCFEHCQTQAFSGIIGCFQQKFYF